MGVMALQGDGALFKKGLRPCLRKGGIMGNPEDIAQVSEELNSVREDLRQLRSDLQTLMKDMRGEGGQRLEELRERVAAALHERSDAVQRGARAVKDSVEHGVNQAKQTAEEHPFATAAAALVVGMIAGACLSGRRR